ncbi:MAG: T9SS type A sorting domain-containing protein [Bacteroidetes bacterium]|nr:T9SS type A sorting domain-containing protein [Bacteroidota bacterium]MBU1718775.1 T9SS type A sorting domain-containing protein [Bacteroidota bacterium]
MRKIFTLFFFVLAGAFIMNAQNIVLMDHSDNSITNSTMTVSGDANTTIEAHIKFMNNSSGALDIKVKKMEVSTISGTSNTFCYNGNCYSPSTTVSPTAVTLSAGQIDSTNFWGDYSASGNVGSSSIMYIFFDVINPSDSSFVTVTYTATANNISEASSLKSVISEPFPNPSRSSAKFQYCLARNAQEGKLIIFDLLGTIIEDITLPDREGVVSFETISIQNGVYFYSFIVDDKKLSTRKMIIKH